MSDYQYTAKVFDAYEKRFAQAHLAKPFRDPTDANARADILREAREMLCIDSIPIPKIKILQQKDESYNNVTVRFLQFCSWAHCYGEATLLLPQGMENKRPAIVICNGHSPDGRLGEAYQKMAFSLAEQGFAVLMSDNLGQGSRKEFGHKDAEAPLCAGITLQGMIVAESNAWIEWLSQQPFVDNAKIGTCGNSGGGTLALFLAATCKRLSAVASCGYPSEFSYVHEKEKQHCACNLLRGCAHRADMWEIYSTFAPKPLMLLSGKYDPLFPADIFCRTSRKVRAAYEKIGAGKNFESAITATKHSWEREDIEVLTDFFCRRFDVTKKVRVGMDILEAGCRFSYPNDAISTNQLAENMLGVSIDKNITLPNAYVPTLDGEPVDPSMLSRDLFACDPMRILVQMEFALTR